MKKYFILYMLIISIIIPTSGFGDNTDTYIGNKIVKEAALWLGSPYGYSDGCYGYGSPVDCSGLVMQVYRAFGIELPRTSALQALEGTKVELDKMVAGDIVCFMYEDGSIGHVGIYIGADSMIHSPRPDKTVEISTNFEDWGSIKAVYGRRIEVESDYCPAEPAEDIRKKIDDLLLSENSLTTNHLEDILISEAAGTENTEENITEGNRINKVITLEINNPVMMVDGTEKFIDGGGIASPRIINDRTHLPIRAIAEEFGATVEWIGGDKKEIRLSYGSTEITLWANLFETYVNGETKYIDSTPIIIDNTTYLPLRFIANEFGWKIDWDDINKKISLSNNKSEI